MSDDLVFDWGNSKVIFTRLNAAVGIVLQKGKKTKTAALSLEDAERLQEWLKEHGQRR